jgi:hypothetical protein
VQVDAGLAQRLRLHGAQLLQLKQRLAGVSLHEGRRAGDAFSKQLWIAAWQHAQ